MSAGEFSISKYECSTLGVIMPIKLQPETNIFAAGVANAEPAGAITLDLFAHVSGGKNEYGVTPRKVRIKFTDQAAVPDGYSGDELVVPVMTEAAYNAYTRGTTGTYLGAPIQIVSKIPEYVR